MTWLQVKRKVKAWPRAERLALSAYLKHLSRAESDSNKRSLDTAAGRMAKGGEGDARNVAAFAQVTPGRRSVMFSYGFALGEKAVHHLTSLPPRKRENLLRVLDGLTPPTKSTR